MGVDQGGVFATPEQQLRGVALQRHGLAFGLWGEADLGKTYRVQALLRELPCRSLSLHAAVPLRELALTLPHPRRLPVWAGRTFERLQLGEAVGTSSAADAERLELVEALAHRVAHSRGVGLLITSRRPPPDGFGAQRQSALDAGVLPPVGPPGTPVE